MKYLVKGPRRGFSLFNDDFMNEFFTVGFPKEMGQIMRTDVIEEEDKYVLNIDVPGFNKEDIKLTFEEGYLKVEAVRESTEEKDEKNYIRRERHYGSCSRTFFLGEIDEDQIKANYTNGILTVTLPKVTETVVDKVKSITIE